MLTGATASEDGKSTYGRIQVTLPATWGPGGAIDQNGEPDITTDGDETFHEKRQPEPQRYVFGG